jgi:uncharacterized protein YchJ
MSNAFFKRDESAGYLVVTALASWFAILAVAGPHGAAAGSDDGAPLHTASTTASTTASVSSGVSAARGHWRRIGYRWFYESEHASRNAAASYEGEGAFAIRADLAPDEKAERIAGLGEGRWLKIAGRWEFVRADMTVTASISGEEKDDALSRASAENGYWLKVNGRWEFIKADAMTTASLAPVYPAWMTQRSRRGFENGVAGRYVWRPEGRKGAGRFVFRADEKLAQNASSGRWLKIAGRWEFVRADMNVTASVSGGEKDDALSRASAENGYWLKVNGRWEFIKTDAMTTASLAPVIPSWMTQRRRSGVENGYEGHYVWKPAGRKGAGRWEFRAERLASGGRWLKRNGAWEFVENNAGAAPAATASLSAVSSAALAVSSVSAANGPRWVRRNGRWVFDEGRDLSPATTASAPAQAAETGRWVRRNGAWIFEKGAVRQPRHHVRRHWVRRNGAWVYDMADVVEDRIYV